MYATRCVYLEKQEGDAKAMVCTKGGTYNSARSLSEGLNASPVRTSGGPRKGAVHPIEYWGIGVV